MQSVQVKAAKIDGEQMDALLKRFERPLLQYATRILGDSDRARDVVQETFVKLQYENRTELDDAPAKWLFTVCRNGALNICRKEKRMTYLDQELLETRESEQPAPYEKLEAKEASGFLLRILARSRRASRKCCSSNFKTTSATRRSAKSRSYPSATSACSFTTR